MKIGELSTMTECPVETVRYYERVGLLPAPSRTDGNYRIYTHEHADRLIFIRHCRSLDMTIEEIRSLLQFRDEPDSDCAEVNSLLDKHITDVRARIRDLKSLEQHLRELRTTCSSAQAAKNCGILQGLADGNSCSDGHPNHHLRRYVDASD